MRPERGEHAGSAKPARRHSRRRGATTRHEEEPVRAGHPLAALDNVLLAPHAIAWTDELFRDIGRTACQSMLDLSRGKRPAGVLNPELLERESFRAKWSRISGIPQEELA